MPLTYKIKAAGAAGHVVRLDDRATFSDLTSAIEEKTSIAVADQLLTTGFPPAHIGTSGELTDGPTTALSSFLKGGLVINVKLNAAAEERAEAASDNGVVRESPRLAGAGGGKLAMLPMPLCCLCSPTQPDTGHFPLVVFSSDSDHFVLHLNRYRC